MHTVAVKLAPSGGIDSIGTMTLSYEDGTTHNIELSRLWDIDMQFAGLLGGRFK